MKRYLPYISVVAAMLIWSVSGIAIKEALHTFPPLTMIVMRFSLAVLLMGAIGLLFRGHSLLGLQRLDRHDIPLFLAGGFFQPFLYYLLETYTYDALTSPTVAEALLSTSPLLSPLFALVLLRERVTWWNIAGILVSTAGMLMLVLAGSTDFQIGSPWGVPLAFAAVSTAVLYTIILRRIPSRYNALTIVFHIQAISLLFFWPLWGLKDAALQADLWVAAGTTAQWWQSLGGVLYLAIFSSVAAFIMFCYTVRRLGVTRTNAFNNVRPVFTALFMFLFFAEQLPWGKLIGILLIVLGLFVSQRK